jgi:16S rRNA processing protein RimM|tara:strand:+ start:4450 stop:4950 length:501 start_codon:yes stop_codon:yes gene_type:complete
MINKDSLISIGYISRPHSYKGDVQLTLERKIVPLKRDDFLFIKIQGQFIPYKMIGIKGKDDEPILTLEFIDTFDKTEEIIAKEVFTDKEVLPEESELTFIGFQVIDKYLGSIGIVQDIVEMPQQLMLLVPYNGELKYIPLVDDFIDYISPEDKEIVLILPDGLLEI